MPNWFFYLHVRASHFSVTNAHLHLSPSSIIWYHSGGVVMLRN